MSLSLLKKVSSIILFWRIYFRFISASGFLCLSYLVFIYQMFNNTIPTQKLVNAVAVMLMQLRTCVLKDKIYIIEYLIGLDMTLHGVISIVIQ